MPTKPATDLLLLPPPAAYLLVSNYLRAKETNVGKIPNEFTFEGVHYAASCFDGECLLTITENLGAYNSARGQMQVLGSSLGRVASDIKTIKTHLSQASHQLETLLGLDRLPVQGKVDELKAKLAPLVVEAESMERQLVELKDVKAKTAEHRFTWAEIAEMRLG